MFFDFCFLQLLPNLIMTHGCINDIIWVHGQFDKAIHHHLKFLLNISSISTQSSPKYVLFKMCFGFLHSLLVIPCQVFFVVAMTT